MIAGNIRFRVAVMQALDDYQYAEDRIGKPVIVRAIISHTYSTGGCFLRRDLMQSSHSSTVWVELNFQEQKDKVRHALRDAIAELKLKKMKAAVAVENTVQLTVQQPQPYQAISSSDVVEMPDTSQSHASGDRNVPVPAFSTASPPTLLNQDVLLDLLLQINRVPNTSLGVHPTTVSSSGILNSDTALSLQLPTQLQLLQMNRQNDMNHTMVLQMYQQLQKEQQIQNVHNYVRSIHATKLALHQRNCINLHAYIANLKQTYAAE